MRYTMPEKKVLKKLGIEDFRHMTKDKIVEFASMLPKMDPEVAMTALTQFPEFKTMAIEVVNNLKQELEQGMDSESRGHDQFYESCNKVIDLLNDQLSRENLTEEQEKDIRNNIMQVVTYMYEKDTEHKEFVLNVVKTATVGAGVILLAAASVLGGRIDFKKGD